MNQNNKDMIIEEKTLPSNVAEYNNSLTTSEGILTGREFRRMKRKAKK